MVQKAERTYRWYLAGDNGTLMLYGTSLSFTTVQAVFAAGCGNDYDGDSRNDSDDGYETKIMFGPKTNRRVFGPFFV